MTVLLDPNERAVDAALGIGRSRLSFLACRSPVLTESGPLQQTREASVRKAARPTSARMAD